MEVVGNSAAQIFAKSYQFKRKYLFLGYLRLFSLLISISLLI